MWDQSTCCVSTVQKGARVMTSIKIPIASCGWKSPTQDHTHIHAHRYRHEHTDTQTQTHTQRHMHSQRHTHTHTQTHTHTRTHSNLTITQKQLHRSRVSFITSKVKCCQPLGPFNVQRRFTLQHTHFASSWLCTCALAVSLH